MKQLPRIRGQFLALGNAIDFLSGIGVDHIQARLFHHTSRWMTRAQRVPSFRGAVIPDPTLGAGLVGFELSGKDNDAVHSALRKYQVLVGGTEYYAAFSVSPKMRRGVCFARMSECAHRQLTLTDWRMRSRQPMRHEVSRFD